MLLRSILANNFLVSHILLLFDSYKGSWNKLKNRRNSGNISHIALGTVRLQLLSVQEQLSWFHELQQYFWFEIYLMWNSTKWLVQIMLFLSLSLEFSTTVCLLSSSYFSCKSTEIAITFNFQQVTNKATSSTIHENFVIKYFRYFQLKQMMEKWKKNKVLK